MTGLRACGCDREGCDRMECVTCGMSDCKWPGDCYGKCKECGATARPRIFPLVLRDDGRPFMDMYCSQECESICWKRADDAGLIVSLSDITPERANELFGTIGLKLEGIGPVTPS